MNQLNKPSNVNQSQMSEETKQFITDLKSGKLNPKQKSLEDLNKITPQQKDIIKQSIPKLRLIGQSLGISNEQINQFLSELKMKL